MDHFRHRHSRGGCAFVSQVFSPSLVRHKRNSLPLPLFSRRRVGVEMVESYYAELHAASNFQLSMLAAVEEGLEMAGVIVFINALLTYIAHHHEDVLLRFSDRKQNPSSVISINRHAA
jgi:hypothetical protein